MRQLRRWKRLWRRSLTGSHKRTSMGHSRSCWNSKTSALQPEEITSKGIKVSCVYYQWKCPYEKSLETYFMIFVSSIFPGCKIILASCQTKQSNLISNSLMVCEVMELYTVMIIRGRCFIAFNGMPNHLGLFYTLRLRNRIYCTFGLIWFTQVMLKPVFFNKYMICKHTL